MENFDSLIEQLSSLTITQIGELRSKLETKWGVSATVATIAPTTVEVEPAKAEPTEFAVYLTGVTNKMGVIRVIREIANLGLLQARDFVDGALPQEIKTGLTKEEADDISRRVVEAGGTVDIKPA